MLNSQPLFYDRFCAAVFLLFLYLVFLDVAGSAVARAACGLLAGAVGPAVRFARLVHGAFDAEFLHVFIGRDLRVDVVTLDHQREGHAQYEQPDGEDGAKQDD